MDSKTDSKSVSKQVSKQVPKQVSNQDSIILFILLGIPLLIQYYSFSKKIKNNEKKYWTNNSKNNLTTSSMKYYKISIIISAICGLYLFYYLSFETTPTPLITSSIAILLLFSLLWIPTFGTKYNTFVLLMVSIGALMMLIGIVEGFEENPLKTVAIVASSYLFFHVTVLDLVFWTGIIKT